MVSHNYTIPSVIYMYMQYHCLFPSAPSPVVNLTVSNNSTHITVMWQEPAEPNGILQYTVSITGEHVVHAVIMSHRFFNISSCVFGQLHPSLLYCSDKLFNTVPVCAYLRDL